MTDETKAIALACIRKVIELGLKKRNMPMTVKEIKIANYHLEKAEIEIMKEISQSKKKL